ncbi:hypothetical protein DCF83_17730 (plasmid) [Edwardsiella tarda]|uniref:hypothetical protein n=1 Tax=Edwardsiella tarda TaxID=636 RepID=UPI000D524C51|nr:hypothetical protein [Edwardsiella tarda]UCQ29572.1 hypothetical protein DCF83_17730 [Edwardsiella tarda]
MKARKSIENYMMYPGMALMCAAVAYFYLGGMLSLPPSIADDPVQAAFFRLDLIRDTLALFLVGAALALCGWGIAVYHAWQAWRLPREGKSDASE